MPRQWAAPSAPHPFVDVTIKDTVECIGARCRQTAAHHRREHHHERRHPARRKKHCRHGGHQKKLDDAGLGEPEVGRDNVANSGELTAAANGIHPEIDASCANRTVFNRAVVGGHLTWHVETRHKLYSLTSSRLRSS